MKQLDLFAGIGGLSLAAEWAGIQTVAFCEKEPFAQKVLNKRFPGLPIYEDVRDLTKEALERDGISGIDIVSGGFPCQPFSHAGKRKGTGDDRYLWPEMLRIVKELRPSFLLAENVNGLVSMAQSDWDIVVEDETTLCEEAEMVIETIRKDLEDIGYQSIPIIIPACGIGASHQRYRVFIVGYTERRGCSGQSWGRTEQVIANGHIQCATRTMGDSASSGLPERGRSEWTKSAAETGAGVVAEFKRSSETLANPKSDTERRLSLGERTENAGSAGSSENVADASCERCREAWADQCGGSKEWTPGCGANVADSSSSGQQKFDSTRVTENEGFSTRCVIERGVQGAAQPGVGGMPYELSDWMDGFGMNPIDALINFISSYQQPALMGQQQHSWEPPRVTEGKKNRGPRLKALGNAVDPLQALPIFYGIRTLYESTIGESSDLMGK
ncbi:DNA cytosine methyltransferase [Paenibacillus xylanexedens]|uniref:DNA cytosine methyltransferase n=1 Tax=Paenibacillus xylanexedens TaxID=528191 RepID=UPI003B0224C9